MDNDNIKKVYGFTLVELSIVLVIIGLIVGGIVSGKTLIRQSELRSLVSEITQYKAAVHTFRLQYDAIPGDFRDATQYWPNSLGSGNGDNKIFGISGGIYERYMFWDHLALAEMIHGIISLNSSAIHPLAPLGGDSQYAVEHYVQYYHSGKGYDVRRHFITVHAGSHSNRTLTTTEAYNIDKKNDNGLPGLGDVRVAVGDDSGNGANQCATTKDTETARYNLDNPNIACTPYFLWD